MGTLRCHLDIQPLQVGFEVFLTGLRVTLHEEHASRCGLLDCDQIQVLEISA
jgi:hypothetical protein